MGQPFYKTVPLTQFELAEAMASAKNQDEKILLFMRSRPSEGFTALNIQAIYPNWPITSIRRSLNSLEELGLVTRIDFVPGDKGMRIGKYRLSTAEEQLAAKEGDGLLPERLAQQRLGKILLNKLIKQGKISFTGKRPKKFKQRDLNRVILREFFSMEETADLEKLSENHVKSSDLKVVESHQTQ